ncbi:MAG: hypothetical protein M1836_007443 [Candelina mexicana]|nr:MAG: hypothetical protein M1836_007443 [Candelina mexicana]
MSFKLSELLNPAPSSGPSSPAIQQKASPPLSPHAINSPKPSPPRNGSGDSHSYIASTHDAVDVLTASATRGAQPSQNSLVLSETDSTQIHQDGIDNSTTSYSKSPRQYGPAAIPIEPSAPLEQPGQSYSPTLAQYHHSSHSSQHQRRQSNTRRASPPLILAPIQSLPTMSNDQKEATPPRQEQIAQGNETRESLPEAAEGCSSEIVPQLHDKVSPDTSETPLTSQIHQASPAQPPTLSATEIPPSSPPADVKLEASATPRESTPLAPIPVTFTDKPTSMRAPSATPTADIPTPKGVVTLKEEERSIKAPSSEASTPSKDTSSANGPKAGSKKRPAPKSTTAENKKGGASTTKKPAAKKRKLDTDSNGGTPSTKRSVTPASSRASKTPAASARKNSITPAVSSPVPAAEDEDDMDIDEEAELFCICRKPDNHTWMIGCDGGCEDWFHGKCVNIKEEDAALIDKYICPNCEKKDKGNTTWLPMCRLDGCRKPARLSKKDLSKYCSDDHGREFMRLHAPKLTAPSKKRRKQNHTDHDGECETMNDNRGGQLGDGHLAAITKSVNNVDDFRKLGEDVPSPPPTASPEAKADAEMQEDPSPDEAKLHVFDTDEERRVQQIHDRKRELKTRLESLKDREKFLGLVKARAKRIHDDLGGGKKIICGFDARLSWADEEFDEWRMSSTGQAALSANELGPPEKLESQEDDQTEDEQKIGRGACTKRHCERHKTWQKIQLENLLFEEAQVKEETKKLVAEESSLRERAKLRFLGKGMEGKEGRTEIID